VDVTTGLAFGRNVDSLKSETDDVIQVHLNRILPALFQRTLAPVDVYRWLDWKTAAHVRARRKAVHEFIQAARAQLRENPALREHPVNLIQAMLAANEREENRLSDAEVAGNVLTMLLAGEDTTANTLAWLTWLLHRNALALETARAEVREVLGGARVPESVEQLGRLCFVEACANEAMRLKPVAPIIINEAAEDTVVDGVALTKGSLVVCMMRPAGVSAEHFPEPQAFDPSRWLGDAAHAGGLQSPKRVVMPFGAGPRMCPGRYLALAEIKMVTAMLLAGFDLEDVSCADGAEPRERLALTMSPQGLRMRLRARA
jgi:cytochrome P450